MKSGKCPICESTVINSPDAMMMHVLETHMLRSRSPHGLEAYIRDTTFHLLEVMRGEAQLSSEFRKFIGPGGHSRQAAAMSKKPKIVLNGGVSIGTAPPSTNTYATPKRRKP